MAAPVTGAPFVPQGLQQTPSVTFLVDGEEISVETRYLLPCDYFNTMLNSGMNESLKGRISVEEIPAAIFKEFVAYLKRPIFPQVDFEGAWGLFILAHRYQHQTLLTLATDRLKQEMPSHLKEILALACNYDNCAELKSACQTYAQNNSYQVRSLLSQLIEEEEYDAFSEVLTWNRDCLYQMMQYSDGSQRTPFTRLLEKQKFGLAAQYLNAARKSELRTYNLIAKPQEAIFEILGKEKPSPEQNELVKAIAQSSPEALTQSGRQEPPLHLAVRMGWDQTFEDMLSATTGSVYNCYAGNQTLLSLAISLKRIAAIQAMKKQMQSQPMSEDEARRYVKESVETDNLAVVEEVVKLPCRSYGNNPQRVDRACIEAVIRKGTLTILSALWPQFSANSDDAAQLRKQAYVNGQFQLAQILFSQEFDAASDIFPGDDRRTRMPWIHKVASDASLEWIQFMLTRCKDLNKIASYYAKDSDTSFEVSPVLRALLSGRQAAIIHAFLEAGADVNAGQSSLLPVHYIYAYEDSVLFKAFLARKPKLDNPNYKGQNFFHLYFLGKRPMLTDEEFQELAAASADALKAADQDGNTPLHLSIQARRLQEASLMLDQEASLLWAANKKKQRPMDLAKGEDIARTISFFVDKACTSKKGRLKRTLLLWCAQNHYYIFCDRLIGAGADIKVCQTGGITLLHLACQKGAHKAASKLLTLNLSANTQDDKGITPLQIAAEKGDVALGRILLDKQADPNLADKSGKTPLHISVAKGDAAFVSLLASRKADPNQMDHQGITALSMALEKSETARSDNMQKIIETLETESCKVQ
ncbi:MAG: ankyrin repeat domain-containing protein [Parachlamydia sp.]|nr:ankyrin repeat domain-containing protein [Parachlamydia sp.]